MSKNFQEEDDSLTLSKRYLQSSPWVCRVCKLQQEINKFPLHNCGSVQLLQDWQLGGNFSKYYTTTNTTKYSSSAKMQSNKELLNSTFSSLAIQNELYFLFTPINSLQSLSLHCILYIYGLGLLLHSRQTSCQLFSTSEPSYRPSLRLMTGASEQTFQPMKKCF